MIEMCFLDCVCVYTSAMNSGQQIGSPSFPLYWELALFQQSIVHAPLKKLSWHVVGAKF